MERRFKLGADNIMDVVAAENDGTVGKDRSPPSYGVVGGAAGI